MWIKICGITSKEDALGAAQAGADALGFIFVATSPRCVRRDEVVPIVQELPSSLVTVAVVANETPEFLKGLLRVCPVRAFQFHGEESPEDVLALKGEAQLIKTIRVKDEESLKQIPLYRGVDAILLDAYHPKKRGGTGTSFRWDLVARAKSYDIPIIVAGGLTPDNVVQVIQKADPYGVDVSSGVELSPGEKSPALVRQFIRNAHSAAASAVRGTKIQ